MKEIRWRVEFNGLPDVPVNEWQLWEPYTSEENAQLELAHRQVKHPTSTWRIVKETVTREIIPANATIIELARNVIED